MLYRDPKLARADIDAYFLFFGPSLFVVALWIAENSNGCEFDSISMKRLHLVLPRGAMRECKLSTRFRPLLAQ